MRYVFFMHNCMGSILCYYILYRSYVPMTWWPTAQRTWLCLVPDVAWYNVLCRSWWRSSWEGSLWIADCDMSGFGRAWCCTHLITCFSLSSQEGVWYLGHQQTIGLHCFASPTCAVHCLHAYGHESIIYNKVRPIYYCNILWYVYVFLPHTFSHTVYSSNLYCVVDSHISDDVHKLHVITENTALTQWRNCSCLDVHPFVNADGCILRPEQVSKKMKESWANQVEGAH